MPVTCKRHGVEHPVWAMCPVCLAELEADPVGVGARLDADRSGYFGPTPDLDDPAQALAHRAMEAVKRAFAEEFKNDPQSPNVTIVVASPPDGRIGIASTEPDAQTILMALKAGWGAVKRSVRLRAESN
jgi:hypothetical protein